MSQSTNNQVEQARQTGLVLQQLAQLKQDYTYRALQETIHHAIYIMAQCMNEETNFDEVRGDLGVIRTLAEFFRKLEEIESPSHGSTMPS